MNITTNENGSVIAELKATPPHNPVASKENAICDLVTSRGPIIGRQNDVHLIKLKARIGDVVVGEVFIRRTPDLPHDRICSLYVLPSYRRCGIGRSLMQAAIEEFGKERELRLRAHPGFVAGPKPDQNDLLDFYRSLGFVSYDELGGMKRSPCI